MLYRGLRFSVAAGGILMVLGFAMYVVLREYNAPASIEFGLIDLFVVTFASLVLTFFTGAILYDYQIERDRTEKAQIVSRLLRTELSYMLGLLDDKNAAELRLAGTETTSGVVLALLEPVVLPGATRDGFFDHDSATQALRLLGNVATYNTLVRDLLLPASLENPPEVSPALVLKTGDLRRDIVRDATALKEVVG